MTCVVIDDEPLARKGMELLIEQIPSLELKGCFSNVIDAGNYLATTAIDILFIDIQMPGINGIDYLKSVEKRNNVIITTAFPQFAIEAFDLNVVDYLVKPIRFDRFYKAVARVMNINRDKIQLEEDYIFIRTERKYIRANYNEIDYVEGLKDYVIVHCDKDKHMVAANLKTVHSVLPQQLFIRINKSFIVNISKVKSLDNDWVTVQNKMLPIGDNYKKSVIDFINLKKVLKR